MNIFTLFNEQKKIGFDDISAFIKNKISTANREKSDIILINTLPASEQDYLIAHTIHSSREESVVNSIIKEKGIYDTIIILYGKHTLDDTMESKRKQLANLGFQSIYIYYGGLFEWSLLQDVYGIENFPTTCKAKKDLLYLFPPKIL